MAEHTAMGGLLNVWEESAVMGVRALEIIVARQQASSSTASPSPSATQSTAAASSSAASTNNNGATQSPLLFFVALGFGVVFTNLWIIVGVKYCFRYNARNRAIARGEIPDGVQLDQMPPGRPHRRRREKKLMSMDEVNERFPMQKYKNWTATRASAGLPTAGGINAPSSRAASLRNVEGVVPSSPVDTKHSDERPPSTSAPEIIVEGSHVGRYGADSPATAHALRTEPKLHNLTEVATIDTAFDPKPDSTRLSEEELEEDDHIHDALPVQMVEQPGDACAICIDTLEPDDDIRGLTCGHAFHAGCLDPWLTSRRACCPLCKADYYVPKPKPEGEQQPSEERRRGHRGIALPAPTHGHWGGVRGHARLMPSRFANSPFYGTDPYGPAARSGSRRNDRNVDLPVTGAENPTDDSNQRPTFASRMTAVNPFSAFRMPPMRFPGHQRRGGEATSGTGADSEVTPAQLEDGTVVR